MKQFYFLALIFIAHSGRSQEDTLFSNEGAYWDVKYWFGYPETIYASYSVGTSPDKVLYNDTLWYTTDYGYLLIDSGKIYFKSWEPWANPYYAHQDTLTHLLYNFNLEIGDTAYVNPSGQLFIVMDIDASYFLGVPRRALYLGNGTSVQDTWIQGLGSDKGLFYPWTYTFEAGSMLCYFSGDFVDSLVVDYTLMYDNPQICEGLKIDESNDLEQVVFGINQISFFLEKSQLVKIYDVSGKLIYAQKFYEANNLLPIDFLKTGIYFLQLDDSKPHKFIKH